MGVYDFDGLQSHVGHKFECVTYGKDGDVYNVSLECVTCNSVIMDFDNPEHEEEEFHRR